MRYSADTLRRTYRLCASFPSFPIVGRQVNTASMTNGADTPSDNLAQSRLTRTLAVLKKLSELRGRVPLHVALAD